MTPAKKSSKPSPKKSKKPAQQKKGAKKASPKVSSGISRASRGQAMRASRRTHDDAHKVTQKYLDHASKNGGKRANVIDDSPHLRFIALGGMDGGGSKNMIVIEYQDEAIIVDVGNDLVSELPGVNFLIPDFTYLEQIKHKIKGYVLSHGHLDHIAGLPYVLPKYPAPLYASKFTMGMVEKTIEGAEIHNDLEKIRRVVLNQDTHEKIKVSKHFSIELVRLTHSIPGNTAIVIDTPVGRIFHSSDFKLDPEPLDHQPSDIERLKQLGDEGIHLYLGESTTTGPPKAGRTPTESTLEPSIKEIMKYAPGRVFVAIFSSNVNRIQMIVNGAKELGKKIAIDGRSMIQTLELAVKLGFVKIPSGTFVPMAKINTLKDDEVIIVCTGSQGEENSALMRMASGDHKHVKMKAKDTVILSSTPIPESGNDISIGHMVDDLERRNVHVFEHRTHEVDNIGPLHVSGHPGKEEFEDMFKMLKPKYFLPIYGAYRAKRRHIDMAVETGVMPRDNCYNAENGEVIEFTKDKMFITGDEVPHGTVMVDNAGAVVSHIVVKDRLMMSQEGLVSVVVTIDKKTNKLLTSPDILTRGFIYMRENEELMSDFRKELIRVVNQRFGRVDIDRFKQELKDHITFYLFSKTKRSPIVIPVVNVVNGMAGLKAQQAKNAEMRNHDQAD